MTSLGPPGLGATSRDSLSAWADDLHRMHSPSSFWVHSIDRKSRFVHTSTAMAIKANAKATAPHFNISSSRSESAIRAKLRRAAWSRIMLKYQEHYEIGSSALLPAASTCGPNASRLSMAQRCGSALPMPSRVIRVSPRAFRRWASSLGRGGSSRWFPSGTQSFELRNRRDVYARRRYRGYLLSVSDSARVDQHTVQRSKCSSVWSAPPKCPVAAEPAPCANEAAGEAKTTKNAKATFTEVLDMGKLHYD
jgi:hypothetical protein